MAWINDSEYTRASVCLVQFTLSGDVNNLLRLMDYLPRIDGTGSYRWVLRGDVPSPSGHQDRNDPDDPKTLYNPSIISRLKYSAEDFIFIKWSPNQKDPKRPWLLDPYAHPYRRTPDFYEVIDCPNAHNVHDLRVRLALGWKHAGTPTKRVFIVYAERGNDLDAILIDRDQLDWSNGILRIKPDARLSAKHYVLDSKRVHEARWRSGSSRYLYDGTKPPASGGNVLIRPLSQYASEYVQWYFRDTAADMGDLDSPHIARMIVEALSAPERLDQYVGLKVSEREIAELRQAAARAALPGDDIAAGLVRNALKHNPAFVERCRSEALKDLDAEADRRREQIRKLEETARQRAEANDRLAELAKPLEARAMAIRRDITGLERELKQVQRQRNETIERIDRDVALKIGLRAAAGTGATTASSIVPVPYHARGVEATNDIPADAIQRNLISYGVTAVDDDCPMDALAAGLAATTSCTNLLAVDSAFAVAIANAVSYALMGVPASHVSIPADWNDATALNDLLSAEDPAVLVLDGPVDTVNESLLFSLSRLRTAMIVILPVGAYGNLKLVAGEVWNHIFYIPTERYVALRANDAPVWKATTVTGTVPDNKTTMEYAGHLHSRFDGFLPLNALTLPGSVASALQDSSISGSRWISSHVALRLHTAGGTGRARKFAGGDDGSLSAQLLLAKIGGTHVR